MRLRHHAASVGWKRGLGRWVLLASSGLLPGTAFAATAPASQPIDYTTLSLEELGAMKLSLVSKKPERVDQVPAAASVLTGDEIHRSGAQTLPEALRLAPGVNVARVDASTTAVSIRGFNDAYSQKLLVLMDGRSVYTPRFSGTYWQAQDVLLDDVDRIEIVRGPGGAVWGANAVNGVINVVTKSASETQGLLVTGGGGTQHLAMTGLRYGIQLGENTFVRFYGKYFDWNNFPAEHGGDAHDAWWKSQGGFRLDWEPSADDSVTFQGDLFGLEEDKTEPQIVLPVFRVPPPPTGYWNSRAVQTDYRGGNGLGRWTHEFSTDSDLTVQAYYDHTRVNLPLLMVDRGHTFDLDLRHRFQWGERNEIVWGGGYRLIQTDFEGTTLVRMARPSRSDEIFNAFVQDELELLPDRLRLTLGTKAEHNDWTGFEIQPGARLAWTPTEKQTIWASVARAVRTPSLFELDSQAFVNVIPGNPAAPFPFSAPTVVKASGSPTFDSETLIAYEMGYRIEPHPSLAVDAAVFVNVYDELRSARSSIDPSTLPNYVLVQSQLNNASFGLTYGGELAITWQAAEGWRLHAQLAVLQANLEEPVDPVLGTASVPPIRAPEVQSSLRSSLDLGRQVQLDLGLRFVDRIDEAGASPNRQADPIPSYLALDAGLIWRPTRKLEISLIGQDLAGSHREYNPTFVSTERTRVRPSVFGKVTWRF